MKKITAILMFLMIAILAFTQDRVLDFTNIQHIYKIDGISRDNETWRKIDPPKTIEITATTVLTPQQVLHIESVIKSAATGDYIINFSNDPEIYIFDFEHHLIMVGVPGQLYFILHMLQTPNKLLDNSTI